MLPVGKAREPKLSKFFSSKKKKKKRKKRKKKKKRRIRMVILQSENVRKEGYDGFIACMLTAVVLLLSENV